MMKQIHTIVQENIKMSLKNYLGLNHKMIFVVWIVKCNGDMSHLQRDNSELPI